MANRQTDRKEMREASHESKSLDGMSETGWDWQESVLRL